jgi:hypothetical protein
LKPENILVDARGHVKVADFGLAGMHGPESGHHLTATAVAMGTINYMAPEQRRDAKHVDGRADLYSLGVILYELLTGELPLGRFKLPGEKLPGLDPRIDAITAKVLETDPEQRYQRASEVGRALEELIGSSGSLPAIALGSGPKAVRRTPDKNDHVSTLPLPGRKVLARGWHGIRVGLSVIGALVVLGVLARTLLPKRDSGDELVLDRNGVAVKRPDGRSLVIDGKKGLQLLDPPEHEHTGPGQLPTNTEEEVYSSAKVIEAADGRTHLTLTFDDGDEQIDCHAGAWKLHQSKLTCTQAGNAVGGKHLKIVPRAYLAHRYFSSDDFAAEADVTLRKLEADFPIDANAQRFAELAYRIRDLQVSLFAVPDGAVKVVWHYLTPDGVEVEGDSSQEVGKLVGDEVVVPPDGETFHLKLLLQKKKGGVEIEAFANDQRFLRKLLPGLEDQTGKVALGCRNMHCTFDNLQVTGRARPQPVHIDAEAEAGSP